MEKLIQNFTRQLSEAMEIGNKAQLNSVKNEIRNVVVSGLGGSGIGGNLVMEVVAGKMKIPMMVNKDYHLPAFVNENTLVIISSYSGNTEETLSAMKEAIERMAKIICVSSGGKIIEIAKANKLDYINIPGGMPPRSCLGYSFVQQLFILKHYGLIDGFFMDYINNAIKSLNEEEDCIKVEAKRIASKLIDKIPVIYITAQMESVAVRFRQQIDENSKMLCWHHVIPEMNHNELVGWRTRDEKLAVIFFRNENDFSRVKQRMNINKEIIKQYTPSVFEIYSKGSSLLEKSLYLIHLGDRISYYLAEMRNMDSVEVKVIDYLKGELAKS